MGTYLIAEFSLGGLLDTLANIGKVAAGLGFVIFVHELGHFLAAKICGVKCEKFYVGFDPPLKYLPSALFKFQWGETEYGIGIIPLGGYVKMLGQDDNPTKAAEEAERARVVTAGPDGAERVELDPRSYVSKSVPQRMFIISAGVLMNLISAVFLAAFAYRAGVNITPVEIGGTSPGDPAWVEGMHPGDKVIQIGKQSEPDEFMRWRWEFTQRVVKAGIVNGKATESLDLHVRSQDGDARWITVTPTDRQKEVMGNVSVGVRSMSSNRISTKLPLRADQPAGQAQPPFKGGDRIVAVNGQLLDTSLASETGDLPSTEIDRALDRHISEEVTLTIERKANKSDSQPQTIDVQLPPAKLKSLGLVMEMGPVVGVRIGSPAAAAGVEVGDVLLQIDGQPVGDPLTLEQRLPAAPSLELTVRRDGQDVTLQVEQDLDDWNTPYFSLGARVALETLGIAYNVSRTVAEVLPDSPAAAADPAIQPGNQIEYMQLVAVGDAHQEAVKRLGPKYNKSQELDDEVFTWAYVHGVVQAAGPGVDFLFTVTQDGERREVKLGAYEPAGLYFARRGLNLAAMQRVHQAQNWGEAMQLGFRETTEKVSEVAGVLGMLVTGQLSLKNLGGPVLIATVAGSEASEGIPRLLLFLTFLSANLAILNFLPIPVLDGGHMLFLAVEGVTGRPVPERFQMAATFVGFCGLMALMVFVFTNDIARLFGS